MITSDSQYRRKESTIKKPNLRSLFPGVIPLFMLAHLAHHLVTALPVPLLPFIRDEFAAVVLAALLPGDGQSVPA